MYMDCDPCDFPHVVALFRRGACWGAMSKSNGSHLRYRDPIYRSLRELAMSYFHEYFDRRGRKTLRSYSRAFDLRRIDPALWVTRDGACEEAHARLATLAAIRADLACRSSACFRAATHSSARQRSWSSIPDKRFRSGKRHDRQRAMDGPEREALGGVDAGGALRPPAW